ncbi:MAG: hypothetical protein GOV01_03775 [Candidatus Altiarchaeota archaeon]|nr:hypothetical protein [Candidatus Altiarchaeota archaeon]
MKLQILLAMMLLTVVVFADTSIDMTSTNLNVVTNDSATITDSNKTNTTPEVTTTGDGDVLLNGVEENETEDIVVVSTTDTTASTTNTNYGSCEIEQETEGGVTKLAVECLLTLPTPCHGVSYGWVPGAISNEYIFVVNIRQRPGVCVEVIQQTTVSTEAAFESRDGIQFNYRINYIPAVEVLVDSGKPTYTVPATIADRECELEAKRIKTTIERLEQQIELARRAGTDLDIERLKRAISEEAYSLENFRCVKDIVLNELPSAAVCVKERLDAEVRLRKLYLILHNAEEMGATGIISETTARLREVKAELKQLPTVTRCAEMTKLVLSENEAVKERTQKLERVAERLREFNIAMRVVNPCEKVEYLDDEIANLEAEQTGVSDEEATAIGEKLGSLVDIKTNMIKACEAIKGNEACVDAVRLRNTFQTFMEKVETGELDASRARSSAEDLLEKFARVERRCLKDVKSMMDNHPCMAAQALEIEVRRMSSTGDGSDIIGDVYNKMEDYKEACVDGTIFNRIKEEARERLSVKEDQRAGTDDVARLIGELELKRFLVLSDETMSQTEKDRIISELEAEKRNLIKEALTIANRARIVGSIKVKLKSSGFEIEGEAVDSEGVTLELPTSGDESLEAVVVGGTLKMTSTRARIISRIELEFENGRLTVRGKAIRMPDEIIDAIGADEGDLEITDDGNVTTYEGNVKKTFRLFAFIPLRTDVFVRADAERGDLLEMRKPWWTVFAIE